ncbi:MAG: DUF4921 family protein [bacterium]|nr:DUF4921 family protein [bacterium]
MQNELRQDLVTGDWILYSPGRAKRPTDLVKDKQAREIAPIVGCPLENPQASGNSEPSLLYLGEKGDWAVQVLPNKYPAVDEQPIISVWGKHGAYFTLPGFGKHDLVITRDHFHNFADLAEEEANLVFRAFRERYHNMFVEGGKYLGYVSIFHNWGPSAGASLFHPHYQMIALPIVPPHIAHSLRGSSEYFKEHHTCVHCAIISQELQDKTRIIFEDEFSITFAPYVSRTPFELRIFPKAHSSYFEDAPLQETTAMVGALQKSLRLLHDKLKDPDYNFYIHTAPILDKSKSGHYHWHIEIEPKISIQAGFELGTGIDINVVDPDEAASFLLGKS